MTQKRYFTIEYMSEEDPDIVTHREVKFLNQNAYVEERRDWGYPDVEDGIPRYYLKAGTITRELNRDLWFMLYMSTETKPIIIHTARFNRGEGPSMTESLITLRDGRHVSIAMAEDCSLEQFEYPHNEDETVTEIEDIQRYSLLSLWNLSDGEELPGAH